MRGPWIRKMHVSRAGETNMVSWAHWNMQCAVCRRALAYATVVHRDGLRIMYPRYKII